MLRRFAILLGAMAVVLIGSFSSWSGRADRMAQDLAESSREALDAQGLGMIQATFANAYGSPSRHPLLSGGEGLDDAQRTKAAQIVAALPGVGGVSWEDGSVAARSSASNLEPLHCQEDVDGLLRTRTIRFEEGSAALLPASRMLLDEVAAALEPCSGAIIAIIGHTDQSGTESANIALSMDRARVVREALVRRGIPRSSLRARGVGSAQPMERLAPQDPANRRIEFSVIRMEPLTPTPVDTPGPR